MGTDTWEKMAGEAKTLLYENIMPFWTELATDRENGGFFGNITNKNQVDKQAEKGLIMHARLLWTFSAVRRFKDSEAFREGAERALVFLQDKLADPVHGGYWWKTSAEGIPTDRNKVVYGQAFALYGMSEALRVKNFRKIRYAADEIFRLMEEKARDRKAGGYLEILSEDWSLHPEGRLSPVDIPCHKSMNTNLHVIEAYANYYRIRPDPIVAEALTSLLRWFTANIYDADRHHLTLFLDEKNLSIKDIDSYGHDIEAAWLCREACRVLGNSELEVEIEPTLSALGLTVLGEGFSQPEGGLDYEREETYRDTDCHWWVQAEAVVGFRDRWEVTNEERWITAAEQSWSFILENIVNREDGEWFWGVDRNGNPLDREKAGLWKTPYHNGRACMELMERITGEQSGNQQRQGV